MLLVAPTGRAARRMAEATAEPASTIHAALGWIPGEGPTRRRGSPLHADLLVVDETSMANLELLVTLLRAVGPGMHVVLVGDADQLAPVGAGKPFAELVASGPCRWPSCTHIFRQAAGSMIVQRRPRGPPGRAAVVRRRTTGMRRDLFLVERDDPPPRSTRSSALVRERLPDALRRRPGRATSRSSRPSTRGALGIDALNRACGTR